MNASFKMILAVALVAIAGILLLVGGGSMTGQLAFAGTMGADANSAPGGFGGYVILVLVDVGLATIVAWMLFGKRE